MSNCFNRCVGVLRDVGRADREKDKPSMAYASSDMSTGAVESLDIFGCKQIAPRIAKFCLVHTIDYEEGVIRSPESTLPT